MSYLLTQSLLSAWQWAMKSEDGAEDFIKALHRERTPQTSAMLDGIKFEGMVTAACEGEVIDPEHKWATGVKSVANVVQGGVFQVKLSRNMLIDGVEFCLYGILDVLKAGHIYDIKKTVNASHYRTNKYVNSPQHPMYFALCEEAKDFTYLISDGKELWRERYTPSITRPIKYDIKAFMAFLDKQGLVDTYCEYWKSKY